jgi:hypothetical protein
MPRSPLTWNRRWRPVGTWRTSSASGQTQAACEEFVDLARADAATAHQLLHFLTLTWRCRSLAEFETERQLLIDLGVPQHYCLTRAQAVRPAGAARVNGQPAGVSAPARAR